MLNNNDIDNIYRRNIYIYVNVLLIDGIIMNDSNQVIVGREFIINDYDSPNIVRQKTKVCPKCRVEKSTDLFYKNKKGQYSSYCIACHLNYNMRTKRTGGIRTERNNREFTGPNFTVFRNYKKIVIEHYSNGKNCCACCGETQIEFLTIDHINNDGKQHRKNIGIPGGGPRFYRWLIKNNFPDNPQLQILCYNCNLAKGHLGYCPHKVKTTEELIPIN